MWRDDNTTARNLITHAGTRRVLHTDCPHGFPNIIVGVTKYVGLEEVKLWTLETELILTHTSRVLDLWMEGLFAIEWAGDADKRVPQRERETDLAFHAYRAAALASSQAEHDRELKEEIIDKISRRAKGQAVWSRADPRCAS